MQFRGKYISDLSKIKQLFLLLVIAYKEKPNALLGERNRIRNICL